MEFSDQVDIKFSHFGVICRFCLRKNDEFLRSLDFKQNENDNENILKMFEKCTNIELSSNQKLPQNICTFCIKTVEEIYKFREMCIKSQERLENVLKLNEIQEENKILEETKITSDQSDNDNFETEYDSKTKNIAKTPKINRVTKTSLKKDKKINKKTSNISKTIIKTHLHKKIKKVRTKKACPVCGLMVLHLSNHLVLHSDAKKYPCTQCDKVYYFAESLERHLKTHNDNFYTDKWSGQCPICGKMYKRLRKHIEAHEKKIKCPQCKHTSWTNEALQKHINSHHRDKNIIICDICNTNFSNKRALRDHYGDIHLKKINYECKVCGKHFQKYETFRIHKFDHNETLPHKCDICSKAFKRKDHLTQHYIIHTDERPYVCPICGKGFNYLSLLKKHKNVHT